MDDGRRVLDLVADHPATARFVCTKLCRRLFGDAPPQRVVAAAMKTWTETRRAKDQIAQTVRVILLSPEFAAAQRTKVRRPLALVAAFARATGLDLMPAEPLSNELANAGQKLFGWPAPTGLPDADAFFLGANSMRRRWALMLAVAENAWGTGDLPMPRLMPMAPTTPRVIVEHYAQTMHGAPQPATVTAVLEGLGWPADEPLGDPAKPDVAKRVARLAALTAMAPEFQMA
jgi:hypothetical protein